MHSQGSRHTNTHTQTHLFSQQAQLTTARVSLAEVPCRGDHRADAPAVGVGRRAVHLPALLRARVQTLHADTAAVSEGTLGGLLGEGRRHSQSGAC